MFVSPVLARRYGQTRGGGSHRGTGGIHQGKGAGKHFGGPTAVVSDDRFNGLVEVFHNRLNLRGGQRVNARVIVGNNGGIIPILLKEEMKAKHTGTTSRLGIKSRGREKESKILYLDLSRENFHHSQATKNQRRIAQMRCQLGNVENGYHGTSDGRIHLQIGEKVSVESFSGFRLKA